MPWWERFGRKVDRKAFNSIYLAQNVGVAIGPALQDLSHLSVSTIFFLRTYFLCHLFLYRFLGYRKLEIAPDRHTNVIKEKKKIRQKAPFYALLIISGGYLIDVARLFPVDDDNFNTFIITWHFIKAI